jgi:transposase
VRLGKTESALVRSFQSDSLLVERVERLMTIPVVGPITALTWALEVGGVQRFSSIKKAINCCGLCSAERSPEGVMKRTPLSETAQQASVDHADRSGHRTKLAYWSSKA